MQTSRRPWLHSAPTSTLQTCLIVNLSAIHSLLLTLQIRGLSAPTIQFPPLRQSTDTYQVPRLRYHLHVRRRSERPRRRNTGCFCSYRDSQRIRKRPRFNIFRHVTHDFVVARCLRKPASSHAETNGSRYQDQHSTITRSSLASLL
jgi:hypothetical protein